MKDHPILFKPEMTKAIIAGTKTQTRRVPVKRYRNWQVGDHIWVRETWGYDPYTGDIFYKADNENAIDKQGWPIKWKPSIHMSRWASRILLEITGLREEHVQDITPEDQIAEGIVIPSEWFVNDFKMTRFGTIWDSINYKRGYGWNKNPLVKVIKFKVERK